MGVDYRGRVAVITGASSGIGEAFATALADRGAHVVLVARSADVLHNLAARIERASAVNAHVVALDLTVPDAAARLRQATDDLGLAVDVLINNAGFASGGSFDQIDADRVDREIALDVAAVAALTRAYLPDMLGRGWGVVVNVASVAGFQPLPFMAVYAAAKAFVLSFSQALWAETRPRGVRVLALCPGPVDTSFFDVLGTGQLTGMRRATPASVVAAALRGVDRGRSTVTPGLANKLLNPVARLLPRGPVLQVTRRLLQGTSTR